MMISQGIYIIRFLNGTWRQMPLSFVGTLGKLNNDPGHDNWNGMTKAVHSFFKLSSIWTSFKIPFSLFQLYIAVLMYPVEWTFLGLLLCSVVFLSEFMQLFMACSHQYQWGQWRRQYSCGREWNSSFFIEALIENRPLISCYWFVRQAGRVFGQLVS